MGVQTDRERHISSVYSTSVKVQMTSFQPEAEQSLSVAVEVPHSRIVIA